jgi:integrase
MGGKGSSRRYLLGRRKVRMTNDEILAAMRLDMERHGLMPSSIEKREICLRALVRWIEGSLLDVTTDDLERFLDGRRTRDGAPIGSRTRFTWTANFAAFYRFLAVQGLVEEDPTEKMVRPKLRRSLPRPAPTNDLRRILEIAPPKERCWVLLAAFQGLRCQEIAGLRREDVLDADALLRVVHGKGDKERLVPLHEEVAAALKGLPMPRTGWLFTRMKGGKYSPNALSMYFNQFLHDNHVQATAHQLRHWFGTELYKSTNDLRLTQEMLGHSDPGTTAVYTAFSRRGAAEAVSSLSFGTKTEPDEAA